MLVRQIGVNRVTHLMHQGEHVVERTLEVQKHIGMHARTRGIRARALAFIFVYVNP